MDETIPLSDCKPGHVYRLRSRNLLFGVFNGSTGFIGIREKFGARFLFTEFHYDKHGTVLPQEDLGPLPEGIEGRESEPTIDPQTDRLLEFRPDPQLPGRGKWHYSDDGSLFEGRPHRPPNTALFEFLEQIEKREEWWRWYDERPE